MPRRVRGASLGGARAAPGAGGHGPRRPNERQHEVAGLFPAETPADRAVSRSKQRETLERELTQEESMLADARKKLSEQEAIRTGDEKNYARVLERLKPYRDTVEVHQKNVDALKRELANLSR